MNATEFKIINTIRRLKNADKNSLEEHTELSSQTIFNLSKSDIIKEQTRQDDRFTVINDTYGYYLGFSIGTSHIKAIILNYAFVPVLEDRWTVLFRKRFNEKNKELSREDYSYVDTPKNLDGLCFKTHKTDISVFWNIVNIIAYEIINTFNINIRGIGVSFSGVVDYKNNIVKSCEKIKYLEGLRVDDLFSPNLLSQLKAKNIAIQFEHNAKSSVIAEKEKSEHCLEGEKNVACLYLGTGIGAGYIFDNKLYRGQNNSSGQIGHFKVGFYKDSVNGNNGKKCTCGQTNCIEFLIRELFWAEAIQDYNYDHLTEDKVPIMAEYVSYLISNLLNCLSLDTIIVTGRFANFFDRIWPYIISYYPKYCFDNLKSLCNVRTSALFLFAPAYGAAICSYFKENKAEVEW